MLDFWFFSSQKDHSPKLANDPTHIVHIFKYSVFNHHLMKSHCADLHSEVVDSY